MISRCGLEEKEESQVGMADISHLASIRRGQIPSQSQDTSPGLGEHAVGKPSKKKKKAILAGNAFLVVLNFIRNFYVCVNSLLKVT